MEQKRDHGLIPDVVIVSGDLAETGMGSEFRDVLDFLEALVAFLDIDRNRVVLIPGNHDINRKACLAYFAEREAAEHRAQPPYAAKWGPFKSMVDQFYGPSGQPFDLNQPYQLFEYPDLHVAIAGMNSTMAESHLPEDHYGSVGEPQCRWFQSRLLEKKDLGWLVIAAVHHNVLRGAANDDENLRDADTLHKILGECTDIILHGHIHEAKTNWWSPNQPILATGSAALALDARPDEIPNQYQLVQIGYDGITRHCRSYAPDQLRWIADARVGLGGIAKHAFHLRNVGAALASGGNEEPIGPTSEEPEAGATAMIIVSGVEHLASVPYDLPPTVDVWVGREWESSTIQTVKTGVVAITGIGGQGKSALAAKALELWRHDNPNGFWCWRDCREERDRFHTQLASVVEQHSQGRFARGALSGAAVEDLAWLLFRELGNWPALIVFDNVDHYVDVDERVFAYDVNKVVHEALRHTGPTVVLLTCRPRVTYASLQFTEIPLRGLTFEEVFELFELRGVPAKAPGMMNYIQEVFSLTEGHPLWLNMIAIQVARNPNGRDSILRDLRAGNADDRARPMLRSIWSGLTSKQRVILRCMAELPSAATQRAIHQCVRGRIKSPNQFTRAFNTLKAIGVVVDRKATSDEGRVDLHPLVRSFIRQEYGSPLERQSFVLPIVEFFRSLLRTLSPNLAEGSSIEVLRVWTEAAEVELSAGEYENAIETLNEAGSHLIGAGYPEEFVRVSRMVFEDFSRRPAHYSDSRSLFKLFSTLVEALVDFRSEEMVREFIDAYAPTVRPGTAQYIGLCARMAHVEWSLGNWDAGLQWADQGKAIKDASDIDTEYDVSGTRGLILRDMGRVDEALSILLKGRSVEDLLSVPLAGESEGLDATTFGNVGRCLQKRGEIEKALACIVRSALMLERDARSVSIKNRGYAALWVGELLEEADQIREASLFYRRSLDVWGRRAPILARTPAEALERLKDAAQWAINLTEQEAERRCHSWLLTGDHAKVRKKPSSE